MLDEKEPSRDPARGTETQSGSSVAAKGFEGRLGFSTIDFGATTSDCAILPFSSHHLCRSELAGGRPGSMASYPIRSSSSDSPRSRATPGCPSSAFRRSYSSRLILFLTASSTILTVH